jgi:1-acyl-sn-glycerol-3-phosphate acyltransferase
VTAPRLGRRSVRVIGNAVITFVGLAVSLPLVALAERVHRGAGRRLAVGLLRVLARLCGVRVVVHGSRYRGSGPTIFVPNHSSVADIPAMLLSQGAVDFAAASELFDLPLLGRTMRALGTVPIDRRRPGEARAQLHSVLDGRSLQLVVFPQGGMILSGEPLRFKTGAFALAIEAGATVVPVVIRGAHDVLPLGRWFTVRPGTIEVELLDGIETGDLLPSDRRALRDRAHAAVAGALVRP